MNSLELRMLYKADTAQAAEEFEVLAHIGKYGDVIIDGYDCPEHLKQQIEKERSLVFPDPDYVRWLEEKVMELLTNK